MFPELPPKGVILSLVKIHTPGFPTSSTSKGCPTTWDAFLLPPSFKTASVKAFSARLSRLSSKKPAPALWIFLLAPFVPYLVFQSVFMPFISQTCRGLEDIKSSTDGRSIELGPHSSPRTLPPQRSPSIKGQVYRLPQQLNVKVITFKLMFVYS